jgi:membrane-associated phospholipid phosphatase
MQKDLLVWLTGLQTPWLDQVAYVLTLMGNEEFYMLIVPLIYWCVSKTKGFQLFYIFLFSIYVNLFLKIHVAAARPVGVEGVNSIFTESAQLSGTYPNDSFPSGHAQASTTLWGYLASWIARPWFWAITVGLILLISFARLYAGLHWPIDVAAGIAIGIVILLLSNRLSEWLKGISTRFQWMLAIVTPLVLALLFPHVDSLKVCGFMLGGSVAYLLEKEWIGMKISRSFGRKVSAFLVGIMGVVVLTIGLKLIIPDDLLVSGFIRYGILGLWVYLGAPWVFIKLGIYSDEYMVLPPNQRTVFNA